jgi:hypothetical protein
VIKEAIASASIKNRSSRTSARLRAAVDHPAADGYDD